MKSAWVLVFLLLALLTCPAFCQDGRSIEGHDDIEIFATLFRIGCLPFDFFGTPIRLFIRNRNE